MSNIEKRLDKLREAVKPPEPMRRVIVVRGVHDDTLTMNGEPLTQAEYTALLDNPSVEVNLIVVEYKQEPPQDTSGPEWRHITLNSE